MKRSAKDCTSALKEECVLLDMVETLYNTSSAPEKRKQARDELSAAVSKLCQKVEKLQRTEVTEKEHTSTTTDGLSSFKQS